MSVTQISQIQVRRGIFQDLGQLKGGEFGWTIDQQRLFIGNGTITEGAPIEGFTEILTAKDRIVNYTYKGKLGGYEVVTGSDGLHPVIRLLQDKLDDIINIKDYGALGRGNDLPAIQRAINQTYNKRSAITPPPTRRIINFHPGHYRIFGELRIPPYCVLRGTGKDGVIIEQIDPSATCLFRTTDSTGTYDATRAEAHGAIEIEGITFKTEFDQSIAKLDSVNDISLSKCKFVGGSTMIVDSISRCVIISAEHFSTSSVYFSECDFAGLSAAAEVSDISKHDIDNVIFDKCTFSTLNRGLLISSGYSNSTKVTNSLFSKIAYQAIYSSPLANGVVSAFNTFINVGMLWLGEDAIPVSSVIEFNSDNNYSIADLFSRNAANSSIFQCVEHHGHAVLSTNVNDYVKLGNSYQTVGKTVVVTPSTMNYVPITRYKHGIINYSVERHTNYRTGTIKFMIDSQNGTCNFHDSYTENQEIGVEIDIGFHDNLPYVICNSDGRSYDSAITIDIKSLINE